MISTILKRNIKYTKAYNQYYYSFESKLHYPCFFTRGQGNIHRPHLWECACVCVCVYECLCTNTCWQGQTVWMWVWEQGCIKAVCVRSQGLCLCMCVWGWDVIVCLLPSCHPEHYGPPAAYKPFRPWDERWGSCFIEMWTEIRAVSTHLSSGQYQGPFHIFIQANLDPLL